MPDNIFKEDSSIDEMNATNPDKSQKIGKIEDVDIVNKSGYFQNLGKSFKYLIGDVLSSQLPVLKDFHGTNKEFIDKTVDSFKDLKTTLKDIERKVKGFKTVKDVQETYKNALTDLKTGNFYNKEREMKAQEEMFNSMFGGFEDDFGDFKDEVGTGVEKGVEKGVRTGIKSAAKLSAISTRDAVNKNAEVNVKMTGLNIKATQSNFLLQNTIMTKFHTQSMDAYSSMNENLGHLVTFANDNMNPFIQKSTEYYAESISIQKNMLRALDESINVQKRMAFMTETKTREPKETQYNKVMGSGGILNLEAYFTNMKDRLIDIIDESIPGMGTMMLGEDEMGMRDMLISDWKNNFWGTLTKTIINETLPDIYKESVKTLNENLKNVSSAFLMKMNRWADDDSGKSGPIWRFIGKLFGTSFGKRAYVQFDKMDATPTPFDKETKESIVNVIPSLLGKIYGVLKNKDTDDEELIWNNKDSKFQSKKEVKKDYNEELLRRTSSGFTEQNDYTREMFNHLGGKDPDFQKKLQIINSFQYQLKDPHDVDKLVGNKKLYQSGISKKELEDIFIPLIKSIPDEIRMKSQGEYNDAVEGAEYFRKKEIPDNSAYKTLVQSQGKDYENLRNDMFSGTKNMKYRKDFDKNKKKLGKQKYDLDKQISDKETELNQLKDEKKGMGSVTFGFAPERKKFQELNEKIKLQESEIKKLKGSSAQFGLSDPEHLKDLFKEIKEQDKKDRETRFSVDYETLKGKKEGHKNVEVYEKFLDYAKKNMGLGVSGFRKTLERHADKEQINVSDILSEEEINSIVQESRGKVKTDSDKSFFGSMTSDTKGSFKGIKDFLTEPFTKISQEIERINDLIYVTFFGDSKDLLEKIKNSGGLVGKFGTFFQETFESINKYFTGEGEGSMLGAMGTFFGFDLNTQWKEFPNVLREGVLTALMGEKEDPKDPKSKRLGGPLTGLVNEVTDIGKKTSNYIFGDEVTDSKGKKLEKRDKNDTIMGNLKSSVSSSMNYIFGSKSVKDDKGKIIKNPEKGIMEEVYSQLVGVKDALLGTAKTGEEAAGNLYEEFKEYLPKHTASGLVGGGIGFLAGMFLPGGPLVGSLIGGVLAMSKSSGYLDKLLFGDKEKNTEGWFKDTWKKDIDQMVPAGTAGAIIGGGGGLLLSALLPGGPITGALLGSIIGAVSKSEKLQEVIFGSEISNPDGTTTVKEGWIPRDYTKKLKEVYGKFNIKSSLATGLIGGALGLGLFGNPILGASIGIVGSLVSQTGYVKELLFGKTDENGKRISYGLMDKMKNIMYGQIWLPMRNTIDKTVEDVRHFLVKDMFIPLRMSFKVIGHELIRSFKFVGKSMGSIFKKAIDISFSAPVQEFMYKWLFKPLRGLLGGVFGSLGPIMKGILKAPVSILSFGTDLLSLGKDYRKGLVDERSKAKIAEDERHQKAKDSMELEFQRRNEIIQLYDKQALVMIRGTRIMEEFQELLDVINKKYGKETKKKELETPQSKWEEISRGIKNSPQYQNASTVERRKMTLKAKSIFWKKEEEKRKKKEEEEKSSSGGSTEGIEGTETPSKVTEPDKKEKSLWEKMKDIYNEKSKDSREKYGQLNKERWNTIKEGFKENLDKGREFIKSKINKVSEFGEKLVGEEGAIGKALNVGKKLYGKSIGKVVGGIKGLGSRGLTELGKIGSIAGGKIAQVATFLGEGAAGLAARVAPFIGSLLTNPYILVALTAIVLLPIQFFLSLWGIKTGFRALKGLGSLMSGSGIQGIGKLIQEKFHGFIQGAFKSGVEWVAGKIKGITPWIMTQIKGMMEGGFGIISKGLDIAITIKTAIENAFTGLKEFLVNLVKGIFTGDWSGVKTDLGKVWSGVTTTWDTMAKTASSLLSSVSEGWGILKDNFKDITDTVSKSSEDVGFNKSMQDNTTNILSKGSEFINGKKTGGKGGKKTGKGFGVPVEQQQLSDSCGPTAAAMASSAITGKEIDDKRFRSKYGWDVMKGLNEESRRDGVSWRNRPFNETWNDTKMGLMKGRPAVASLGGEFTDSDGHYVTLTDYRRGMVGYNDPETGTKKWKSEDRFLSAPGHKKDGKEVIVPTGRGKGKKSYKGGGYYYSQYDSRWGNKPYGNEQTTIGESGCAPTSAAMVLSKWKGSTVTPPQMASLASKYGAYVPGAGTNGSRFFTEGISNDPNLGLKFQEYPIYQQSQKDIDARIKEVDSALASGKMVVVNGVGDRNSTPYTPGGHYVVLNSKSSNGYQVYDPKQTDGKVRTYDRGSIFGQEHIGSAWVPQNSLYKQIQIAVNTTRSLYGKGKSYRGRRSYRGEGLVIGNNKYDALFKKYGDKYNLDPTFLKAIGMTETNLDHENNVNANYAGAIGLMQIVPDTAGQQVKDSYGFSVDPTNLEQNVEAAALYFRWLRENYLSPKNKKDLTPEDYLTLAVGYNGGPSQISLDGKADPNNPESSNYYVKVKDYWSQFNGKIPFDPSSSPGTTTSTPTPSSDSGIGGLMSTLSNLFYSAIGLKPPSSGTPGGTSTDSGTSSFGAKTGGTYSGGFMTVDEYATFIGADHTPEYWSSGSGFNGDRRGANHNGYDIYGVTPQQFSQGQKKIYGNVDAPQAPVARVMAPGVVGTTGIDYRRSDNDPPMGLGIYVYSEIGGRKYRVAYGHLYPTNLKEGDKVSFGDPIAPFSEDLAGGNSGPHVDIKVQDVDTKEYVDWGQGTALAGGKTGKGKGAVRGGTNQFAKLSLPNWNSISSSVTDKMSSLVKPSSVFEPIGPINKPIQQSNISDNLSSINSGYQKTFQDREASTPSYQGPYSPSYQPTTLTPKGSVANLTPQQKMINYWSNKWKNTGQLQPTKLSNLNHNELLRLKITNPKLYEKISKSELKKKNLHLSDRVIQKLDPKKLAKYLIEGKVSKDQLIKLINSGKIKGEDRTHLSAYLKSMSRQNKREDELKSSQYVNQIEEEKKNPYGTKSPLEMMMSGIMDKYSKIGLKDRYDKNMNMISKINPSNKYGSYSDVSWNLSPIDAMSINSLHYDNDQWSRDNKVESSKMKKMKSKYKVVDKEDTLLQSYMKSMNPLTGFNVIEDIKKSGKMVDDIGNFLFQDTRSGDQMSYDYKWEKSQDKVNKTWNQKQNSENSMNLQTQIVNSKLFNQQKKNQKTKLPKKSGISDSVIKNQEDQLNKYIELKDYLSGKKNQSIKDPSGSLPYDTNIKDIIDLLNTGVPGTKHMIHNTSISPGRTLKSGKGAGHETNKNSADFQSKKEKYDKYLIDKQRYDWTLTQYNKINPISQTKEAWDELSMVAKEKFPYPGVVQYKEPDISGLLDQAGTIYNKNKTQGEEYSKWVSKQDLSPKFIGLQSKLSSINSGINYQTGTKTTSSFDPLPEGNFKDKFKEFQIMNPSKPLDYSEQMEKGFRPDIGFPTPGRRSTSKTTKLSSFSGLSENLKKLGFSETDKIDTFKLSKYFIEGKVSQKEFNQLISSGRVDRGELRKHLDKMSQYGKSVKMKSITDKHKKMISSLPKKTTPSVTHEVKGTDHFKSITDDINKIQTAETIKQKNLSGGPELPGSGSTDFSKIIALLEKISSSNEVIATNTGREPIKLEINKGSNPLTTDKKLDIKRLNNSIESGKTMDQLFTGSRREGSSIPGVVESISKKD